MMRLGVIRRKLSSLIHMAPFRRALMAEALLWLAIARVALLIFPFRHVAKRLGDVARPDGHAATGTLASEPGADTQLARDIGWAVRRTALYVPFKAVCLQQAIAAKMMLRRRGVQSALHFGVSPAKPPTNIFKAHAWLDAAGARVTGYPVASEFTEIACFR